MAAPRGIRKLLLSDVIRGWVALIVGFPFSVAGLFVVLPIVGTSTQSVYVTTSAFVSFIVIAVAYLLLTVVAFLPLDALTLRRALRETTPSGRWRRIWWGLNGGGALYWAISGVATAAGGLLLVSRDPATRAEPVLIGLGAVVVAVSFAIIIAAFATRFAREDAVDGGFDFPGEAHPRFGDYVYVAVQAATTFGASDVAVTRSGMRRLVAVNSIVSFGFNTVIVALLVSVLVNSLG